MPFIDRDFINDLSDRVDIVDLINRRVPLKKAGKDYKACCPFHQEKTPSFTVAPDKQIYHCFGCGESGNAIDFVMSFDHLNFQEAVETIASEAGMSVVYDQSAKPVDPKLARYRELMTEVCEFYQQQLKSSVAKNKVVNYAKGRGLSGEIAKRFELGFAPPGWDNLFTHFHNRPEAIQDLAVMGLLVPKKDKKGAYYDRFRDRLMFPIHNSRGDVIAFGGRVLSKEDQPKYLNSPETPIFSKSRELYGLHHARKHSRNIDYILVVEGYMDVVALHQAGITQAVATLGTATTKEHLGVLSRSTNQIVFCFDGDRAGRDAAWKALQIALPVIKSGLVVKFLFLPDGEDPDSMVAKESLSAFKKRIDQAQPLSQFLFDHLAAQVEFQTIEGKTLFLDRVMGFIQQVTYPIYQQQLVEGVAQLVGQSVEQIQALMRASDSVPPMEREPYTEFYPESPIEMDPDFMPEPDMPPVEQRQTPEATPKSLMSKLISIVLNYPHLADEVLEHRVREIKQSQVLLDIIHSAQLDDQAEAKTLIEAFRSKTAIYKRLEQLCDLSPALSESQAKDELLSALNRMEKQQQQQHIKASIADAHTPEAQRQIAEGIAKGKKTH